MHARSHLGRANNLSRKFTRNAALYHNAARLQASNPTKRPGEIQSVNPSDSARSRHAVDDGNDGTKKPEWRRYVLNGRSSNGIANNATPPSQYREGRSTRSAREAREAKEAAQETYSRPMPAKSGTKTSDAPATILGHRTTDRRTLVRFHGVKEKENDPGIFDRVVEQGVQYAVKKESKRDVKPRFVSSAPSPPRRPEALQEHQEPVKQFAQARVRTHLVQSKTETNSKRLPKVRIKKHAARRESLIPRSHDRGKVNPLRIKRYLTRKRLVQGHGAFVRSRPASSRKRPLRSSKNSRTRRSLFGQRNSSRHPEGKRSQSNVKTIARTEPAVTLGLSLLDSTHKSDSRIAQEHLNEEDDVKLQAALKEITYAPPRRPVTFTNLTPRGRLRAVLRRRMRGGEVGGGLGEKTKEK